MVTRQHTQAVVPTSNHVSAVVEYKQDDSKPNHEYLHYLKSQRWRTLSRAVRMRAKGKASKSAFCR
jgi:hypothetical protein